MRFSPACPKYDHHPYEAMTLTENEPINPPADTVGGADLRRRPIDDVGAYLDSLPHDARLGLRTLGELLVGVTQQAPRAETADRFTARALGVTNAGQLIHEERELIRPGVSGEFFCWEGWARGNEVIEAVSRRAEGASGADGGRSAQRHGLGVGGDGPGC